MARVKKGHGATSCPTIEKREVKKDMDIKPVNQINFDYEGKHYTLEYTPETIKTMEAWDFDIEDFAKKSHTRVEQLWNGAFLEHHRKTVGDGKAMEIYKAIKDKEGILKTLATMYRNVTAQLIPDDENDEGNVEWTATP